MPQTFAANYYHIVFSTKVSEYIEKQPEHHRRRDFRAELIMLLRKHGVPFAEQYVFD